jgi:hypothetical protein
MKKGGITPRSTRCDKCHGTLYEDEEWKPPAGYDQRMHKFMHRSDFKVRTCGHVCYKIMPSVPHTSSLTTC